MNNLVSPQFYALIREKLVLQLYAQPGAKKTQLVGLFDERIKIRLNAPPIDGKANHELLRFVGEWLQVRQYQLELLSGHHDRRKSVAIAPPFNQAIEIIKGEAILFEQGELF